MSEMIERVARAICGAEKIDPDLRSRHGPSRRKVPMWTIYAPMARAAIEGMREPTEWMLHEGASEDGLQTCRAVWSLMIVAALR